MQEPSHGEFNVGVIMSVSEVSSGVAKTGWSGDLAREALGAQIVARLIILESTRPGEMESTSQANVSALMLGGVGEIQAMCFF